MAPHSSTLAWEIPWMEEPGRLQEVGLSEREKEKIKVTPRKLSEEWRAGRITLKQLLDIVK